MRIGIDLGGTKIAGIVLDGAGRACLERRVPTPVAAGYGAVVAEIARLVQLLEQEVGEPCSVGLGAPGQTSVKTGHLKNSNATCLNDQPLHEDIKRLLGREVRLANDANCFTLSEATDGAAQNHRLVLGLILGTGVGGGIAIHGRVHNGLNGIAGEWGHICLDPNGPSCYCGRKGCVETLLSGPGLLLAYRQFGGQTATDAAAVARHARLGGDAAAGRAMAAYLEHFGRALAMLINILDPDAVVLGGGLSNMPILYTQGVAAVARHVFNDGMSTPILQHRHGDASGVRGAAMLWPTDEARPLGQRPRPLTHGAHATLDGPARAQAAGRLGQRRTS